MPKMSNADKQYHEAFVHLHELERVQRRGWEAQPIGDVDLGDDSYLFVTRKVRRNDGAVLFGLTLNAGAATTEVLLNPADVAELLALLQHAEHLVGA